MEIQKKEYRIIRQKSCAASQITLDEDIMYRTAGRMWAG